MLYRIVQLISRFLFLLLTRRRITGKENIPQQGPVIFVSNHLSLMDAPLLWVGLGRKTWFMAKEELFSSRTSSYLMNSLCAFSVRKGKADKKALLKARQVLDEGQALAIFPEGMRSQSRKLKLAFPGAALIASRSGVPVIPIGITGTEKVSGVSWLWRHPLMTVNIGKPFILPMVEGRPTKYELSKLTDVIMEHIAAMLPAEYYGHCREWRLNGVKG